ncbi:hypothetical protein [Pseudonocardia sp. DLS-67]
MNTAVLILIIVVVVLLVAGLAIGIPFARRKRSERLEEQFGPEYERSVSETGDRKAAETDLRERQRRHSTLEIRDLRPEEHDRFQESWNSVQRGFVDVPVRALEDADGLVIEIMRVRGYPVDDFDRRAEDISVDHPDVVRHYREARAVRDASSGGAVSTEQQRRALTSYRSLIEALLGSRTTRQGVGPVTNAPRTNAPGTNGRDTGHRADTNRPSEERTP